MTTQTLSIEEKIAAAFPGTDPKAVMVIGLLGSREDWLLYNRITGDVSTGNVGKDRPCFKDTLEEFAKKVETSYGDRLQSHQYSEEGKRNLVRWRAEYRQVIALLRALPDYEAIAEPVAFA